jgi:lipoprotein NlpI/transglutaminase-like putative cysteine protease
MNLRLALRGAIGALVYLLTLMPSAGAQTNLGGSPVKEVQVAQDAFSLGDPVPSWVDPTAMPERGNAQPIFIRLADTQYLVARTPVTFVHRALTINDPGSLTAAGQLPISFVPQYQRLQLHAVRILRGEEVLDRTTTSSVRFLQRETGLEHGVYSDVVTASILVNDLRLGDTLEFAYSLHGQNPVFGGKFADSVFWDQAYPTALRRVVLNHPVERSISWRMLTDGQSKAPVPEESTRDGMRKLQFEERSLAPIAPEAFSPPDYRAYRWLQFSEFSGWDDVVAWADGLFQREAVLDDDLGKVVKRLETKSTNEERVAGALEFVQSEIRYFSISLGESSHRPTSPGIVLKRRYGDCKDKSFLLMTLLRALGIESRPLLLNLGVRKGLDRALPSPLLFNHMIVQAMVDGNVFYLDPTRLGQHGHLSRMGQAHEGAQGLLIAPDTRELLTITSANALELARSELSETVTVTKLGGGGQLKLKEIWNGVGAEAIRVTNERISRQQFVKAIGDVMERRYPGAKLAGEPELRDDRMDNVVSLAALYDLPKPAEQQDDRWFVRFSPVNLAGALVLSPSSARTAPLSVGRFPYEGLYSFEVIFPEEEVSVVSDPRVKTIEDRSFVYTVSSSFRGNVSKVQIDLKTLNDRVEIQDLQKYGEDLRALDVAAKGVVVVGKTGIKSANIAGSDRRDFAQSLRDRLQDAIDKTTETIKSGKLTGSDLAEAYCNRSISYSDLGQTDEALRDANEALKLSPNSKRAVACRATAYFHAGAFDKSVTDYSRAITLGATNGGTFHLRGIANFYAGRLDEAAEDFARAAANNFEAPVYNDLWLAWTSRRLGKPIPDAIVKRAAANPRGDWPAPALALIGGFLDPSEMLALLDGKTVDDRQMALAEGYFYLGQHYLGLGDKQKARDYFQKTRQLGVVIYTEHTAAAFELQRLNEDH